MTGAFRLRLQWTALLFSGWTLHEPLGNLP
jgi:hypothetical protein